MSWKSLVLSLFWLSVFLVDAAQNRVLHLRGDGNHLRLPWDAVADLDEATIEMWVRWSSFNYYGEVFAAGDGWMSVGVNTFRFKRDLQLYGYEDSTSNVVVKPSFLLQLDQWYHVAVVVGDGSVRLYLNGARMGERSFQRGLRRDSGDAFFSFGGRHWDENGLFEGYLDNVRVWRVARSGDEIRSGMFESSLGSRENIVADWNFDGGDASSHDGVGWSGVGIGPLEYPHIPLPEQTGFSAFFSEPALVSGRLTDFDAAPHPDLSVKAIRDGVVCAAAMSDRFGLYQLELYEPGEYEIRCGTSARVFNLGRLQSSPGRVGSEAPGAVSNFAVTIDSEGQRMNHSLVFMPRWNGEIQSFRYFDGLGSEDIAAICETSDGDLLVGSRGGGVVRKEDQAFQPWPGSEFLPSPFVNTILAGDDGLVWVGTDGGLAKVDGSEVTVIGVDQGLGSGRVMSLARRTGHSVWVGTDDGLFEVEGANVREISMGEKIGVYSLLVDSDRLWIGSEWGLWGWDMNRGEPMPVKGVITRPVLCLEQSREGTVWAGVHENLAWGKDREFGPVGLADGLGEFEGGFRCLAQGGGDDIWIGTKQGAILWDGRGFTSLNRQHGLIHDYVTALYVDHDQAVWIGTRGGLSCYRENRIQNFGTRHGHRDGGSPTRLFVDGVELWNGSSDSGASVFDGEVFTTKIPVLGENSGNVSAVSKDAAGMLLLSQGGVYRWNRGQSTRIDTVDVSGEFVDFVRHEDGRHTFVFGDGIASLADGGDVIQMLLPRVEGAEFTAIAEGEQGSYWLASDNLGIVLWRPDADPISFKDAPGMVDGPLNDVCLTSPGAVWAASDQGVARLTAAQARSSVIHPQLAWQTFRRNDGLADNQCRCIFESSDGLLWFATSGGVSFFDGAAWGSLDERDGLLASDFIDIAEGQDGELWFLAYKGGLTRFQRSESVPRIGLESLRVNDIEMLPRSNIELEVDGMVQFEMWSNDHRSTFGKEQWLMTVSPETASGYEGKASASSGFDRPVEGRTTTELSQSPILHWIPHQAGEYRVQLRAINSELNYSDPWEARFSVVLPWWRNSLILGMVLAVGLGLLVSGILFANRFLVHRRKSLEQQALLAESAERLLQLNHEKTEILNIVAHDLRTPLWTTVNFAELLRSPDAFRSKERLGSIAQGIKGGADKMLELVERLLDAERVDAPGLEAQITTVDLGAEVADVVSRFQGRIDLKNQECEIDREPGKPVIESDPIFLRQILENLVSNAIKYSPAGARIRVAIASDSKEHRVSVIDEGPGIAETEQARLFKKFSRLNTASTDNESSLGLGLHIAARLADALGYSLSFRNHDPVGACFTLIIPVPDPR